MKLYTKVVLVLCAVFVAYGLIDYTVQKRVIPITKFTWLLKWKRTIGRSG